MTKKLTGRPALSPIADAERGPTDEELSAGPYVNHYRLETMEKSIQQIYGRVHGHPTIDDRFETTTPLFGFDPDAGWARTRSRWYRLGPDWQLLNPDEREETATAIQRLLKAQRNWVAAEIHDHQKLVKIVKERSDEMPIRKSIDEL
ncbi:DUF6634 family protein [Loktanella sp. Alg231-35]|uniref:DUF6634 family protein n=1 Tax=Loktanella sp. Alg231-35 TaxID=1922220 RepID=UPI002795E44E|nr:DUF6634 family protein [Loktanella sp. Alg231-35]